MLVSLENIKIYLALNTTTYDDLLTLLEESAVSFIESYCNNKISSNTITEYLNGSDSYLDRIFFINNNINITSLTFYELNGSDWDLISDDDYALDENGGCIYYDMAVTPGIRNYKVSYTCGYTTGIPNDLKIAILKIIGKYYNKHKSDGLSDESLDGASLNFEKFMSDDIRLILNKYKLTVI